MKINTWSALLSLLLTLLSFIIGLRIVTGQLQASEIVTSLIIFLPFFIFTFAIFYLLVSHILNKLQNHNYIGPFLTNVSSLTSKFAQTTGTQNFDQSRWDTIAKNNDSPSFWIYRAIILLVFSILSSVLGVLYLIKYVKQMH